MQPAPERACDAATNFAPCPLLTDLLFVVSSFIKTDHESLSGLSCVHKQSAWLSHPAPAQSQADAYRAVFLPTDIKNLNGIAKQKTAKMHCLKQHSFCSSRESRSEFSRAGEPGKTLNFIKFHIIVKKFTSLFIF